jgi:hypothetical protein
MIFSFNHTEQLRSSVINGTPHYARAVGAPSLTVIEQDFLAALADFRSVSLEASEDRKISF